MPDIPWTQDLLDNYESYSLDALMAEREAWEKGYDVLLAQHEALETSILLTRRHLRAIDSILLQRHQSKAGKE